MAIPPTAKRVFRGILHDVYQWQQKLFDGSSSPFEMIVRQPSTEIIATVNDKIIILIQEQPGRKAYPSLPGGRVESDDTPLHTAQRELLEETGYNTPKWTLLDEFSGNQKYFFRESLFLAYNCKKRATPKLDAGEKIKVTFVSFDDFLQLCRNSRFVAAIPLKFTMYEALLDEKKKKELRKKLCLKCTVLSTRSTEKPAVSGVPEISDFCAFDRWRTTTHPTGCGGKHRHKTGSLSRLCRRENYPFLHSKGTAPSEAFHKESHERSDSTSIPPVRSKVLKSIAFGTPKT